MKAGKAAEDIAELVARFSMATEGLKEAREVLDRCLARLRSLDVPSSLLLTLKREGREALNPRSKQRLRAAETLRDAVEAWLHGTGQRG